MERCDRVFRLGEYVKNCHEPCNPQCFFYVVAKVGEFDVTADLPGRNVESHKSAQAAAIDSRDFTKIQNDLAGFVQQVLHFSAQQRRFLVEEDSAAEMD